MPTKSASVTEDDGLIRLLLNMTRIPDSVGSVSRAIPVGAPILITRSFDYFSNPLNHRPLYGDNLYISLQDLPEGANAYLAGRSYQNSLFDNVIIAVQPYRLEFE
jgi:hypothetical protein